MLVFRGWILVMHGTMLVMPAAAVYSVCTVYNPQTSVFVAIKCRYVMVKLLAMVEKRSENDVFCCYLSTAP